MRKLLIILAIAATLLLGVQGVAIGRASAAVDSACDGSTHFLGFPTWYKYLDVTLVDGRCEVTGPPTPSDPTDPIDWKLASGRVALAVVEILLRIATLVSLGYVIYGGFRYITSQGEPDSTKSARQTIMNALIGLVIALLSTAIVAFVGSELGQSSSPSDNGGQSGPGYQ